MGRSLLGVLSWKVRGHRLGAQVEPAIFDSSIFMSLLPPMRYPVALQCASPFRKGGAGLSYPAASAVAALAISLNPSLVRRSGCTPLANEALPLSAVQLRPVQASDYSQNESSMRLLCLGYGYIEPSIL